MCSSDLARGATVNNVVKALDVGCFANEFYAVFAVGFKFVVLHFFKKAAIELFFGKGFNLFLGKEHLVAKGDLALLFVS